MRSGDTTVSKLGVVPALGGLQMVTFCRKMLAQDRKEKMSSGFRKQKTLRGKQGSLPLLRLPKTPPLGGKPTAFHVAGSLVHSTDVHRTPTARLLEPQTCFKRACDIQGKSVTYRGSYLGRVVRGKDGGGDLSQKGI